VNSANTIHWLVLQNFVWWHLAKKYDLLKSNNFSIPQIDKLFLPEQSFFTA
jgi:hypothetical protein